MKIDHTDPGKPRIEMIPLIDSMFLILVYFIYAFLSMSLHFGMPLDLPDADSAVQVSPQNNIVIGIHKDGSIDWNGDVIADIELVKRLRAFDLETTETRVYIAGEREALHGRIIDVFDKIRQSGINKIMIETDPGRG